MDRLTRQIMPDYHGYERTVCTFCPRTGVKACTLTEKSCFALQVYNRLAAYEDTGLTPEEIIVQQSELTRLRAELDAAVKDISRKCVTCGKRRGWETCKEASFISDGEECLNWEWRGSFCGRG